MAITLLFLALFSASLPTRTDTDTDTRHPTRPPSFHGRPTRSTIPPGRERRARLAVVPRGEPIPLRLRRRAGPLLLLRIPAPPLAPVDEPVDATPAVVVLRRHVRAGAGHRGAVPDRRRPDPPPLLLPPPHLGPAGVHLDAVRRRVRRRRDPPPPREFDGPPALAPRALALALVLAALAALPARARALALAPARVRAAGARAAPGPAGPVRLPALVLAAGAVRAGGDGDGPAVRVPGGVRAADRRVAVPRVAAAAVRVRHVRALVQPPARPEAAPGHAHGREAVLLQRRVREDVHAQGRAEETSARQAVRHRRECFMNAISGVRIPLIYTH